MPVPNIPIGINGTLFMLPKHRFVTYEESDKEWMIPLQIGVHRITAFRIRHTVEQETSENLSEKQK